MKIAIQDRPIDQSPLREIFGDKGYSTDLRLHPHELETLRQLTRESWLTVISNVAPDKVGEFEQIEIDTYHRLAHLLDHGRVWTTGARTFSAEMADTILSFSIFDLFRRECPGYRVASSMPPYGDLGRPRINWRLVRPGSGVDLGPIHADYWFDAVLPAWSAQPGETVRVKIWVPIFLEPGLTGFAYLPSSHRQHFAFESKQAPDGSIKPHFDESLLPAPMQTVLTPCGTAFMFNYNLVHRGANSERATRTRVSMEVTIEVPRTQLEPFCADASGYY